MRGRSLAFAFAGRSLRRACGRGTSVRVLALLSCGALAFALGGCLGSDHTFPDESDQVRSLHVNAYESIHPATSSVIVEVYGWGSDKEERAFHGHVHVALEKALHPEKDVQYEPVKAYDVDVTSADFSSQTVPVYKFAIAAADVPGAASYRATATATVLGKDLTDSALFDYTG